MITHAGVVIVENCGVPLLLSVSGLVLEVGPLASAFDLHHLTSPGALFNAHSLDWRDSSIEWGLVGGVGLVGGLGREGGQSMIGEPFWKVGCWLLLVV